MTDMGAIRTTPQVRCSNLKLTDTIPKTYGQKLNPNPFASLRKIPFSDRAALHKSAFVQSVNRTKMFHVKHFCKVGAGNLTKWHMTLSRRDQKECSRRRQSLHVDWSAFFEEEARSSQRVEGLADLNAPWHSVRLHSGGHVHGFAPYIIGDARFANHTGDDRAAMNADPQF